MPRLTQWTLITGKLALGTGAVVWVATDATHVVVGHVPVPSRNGVPFADSDLHRVPFGSKI